jgi:hypothetical protein
MMPEKKLDFYEFAGIIMPGAIFISGLSHVIPEMQAYISTKDITLGTFGVFLILSYAGGHLVQTVGNLVENLMYCDGLPSDWVRTNKGNLLCNPQRDALEEQIAPKLRMNSFTFKSTDTKDWHSITRQMYAAVANAGKADRIHMFNGNYGLNRGLAAALLTVAFVVIIADYRNWHYALGIFLAAVAAVYRMHRFARHYARELLVQFLQLPIPETKAKQLITEP